MSRIEALPKALLKRLVRRLGYIVVNTRNGYFGFEVCNDIARIVLPHRIRTICDVGANVGQYTSLFHRFFPSASVFAFEPVKTTFEKLRENTSGTSGIECFNLALGSAKGRETIVRQPNSEWNSLVKSLNATSTPGNTEIVDVSTIDDLLSSKIPFIDILKTDTEGFDLEVVKGAKGFLAQNRISFVYGEVGFSKEDPRHTSFFELHDYLDGFGFRFVGLYEQIRYGRYSEHGYGNALFMNVDAIRKIEGTDCP